MKILYVTDALAIWGGLERIIINKVNLLADLYGYDMYLITLNQGHHSIPYPLSPQINYFDLEIQTHKQYDYKGIHRLFERGRLIRLFQKKIRQKIQEISPDVIVCVRIGLVKTIAKEKSDIPLVYESHTYRKVSELVGLDSFTWVKVVLNRRSEKIPQMVITLTEGDANDWRNTNPNVRVIPNVVNLNTTGRCCDYNARSVIFVGRFSAQKDIKSLLEVWKIVHEKHSDWQLHIYGGYGEEQSSILPIIERMNTSVKVFEPTPDIMSRYLESSIMMMTSLYEPFGLVLPEAMSCGLPVVAFDCPYGPADIINDGVDGFLIKNRDIHEFAKKVCLLMDDISLRKKMGQAGIVSSQRYSAERIMPKWKELFEQLLDKKE